MARTALAIEREVDDTRSIWGMGASAKREENQFPSSSRKRQKTSASFRYQGRGCGNQSQGRVGAFIYMEQMTCYHCHQSRHMRRDCP